MIRRIVTAQREELEREIEELKEEAEKIAGEARELVGVVRLFPIPMILSKNDSVIKLLELVAEVAF